jgi:hypothetical protein
MPERTLFSDYCHTQAVKQIGQINPFLRVNACLAWKEPDIMPVEDMLHFGCFGLSSCVTRMKWSHKEVQTSSLRRKLQKFL